MTPVAAELLANLDALLTRTHLRERPGTARRRRRLPALDVVALPGYSRPLVKVSDYLELIERSTHDGRTRVR